MEPPEIGGKLIPDKNSITVTYQELQVCLMSIGCKSDDIRKVIKEAVEAESIEEVKGQHEMYKEGPNWAENNNNKSFNAILGAAGGYDPWGRHSLRAGSAGGYGRGLTRSRRRSRS